MFLSNGQLVPPSLDTLGDRTPLFADASYYATTAMPLLDLYAAYAALYRHQLWVGTVVRKLSYGTARMPFEIKKRLSATDSEPEAGPLTDLLERPNERMSGFRLKLWTAATRHIYGEAFWLKLRDDQGTVRELHPMHPTNTIIRRNTDGDLEYIYSAGTRNVSLLPPIPERDVVAFTSYNPDNITRGLSALEGLRETLLNEDASRRATAAMWANGARPSVMLTTEQTLSDPAIARLKAQFEASHSGVANTGKTAVFEEGLKPEIVQLNAEEMQYIESRKLNREEVCAAYDVPPPAVHILDHATFSNITEQLRSMYRDTMAPHFVDYESVIDHQLVPDFYGTDRTHFSRFAMEEVLRGDFETRATAVIGLRNAGILTGNEGRGMFGLTRSDEAYMDRAFANAALVPLGSAPRAGAADSGTPFPAPNPAAQTDPTEAAKPPVTTNAVLLRSIMGRVGRKATKAALRSELVDAHQQTLAAFFERQKSAVLDAIEGGDPGAPFDAAGWDDELATTLHTLSRSTALAIGKKVADDLGGKYTGKDIANWLLENAQNTAKRVNENTASDLTSALYNAQASGDDESEAATGVFDGQIRARGLQLGATLVATVAGLATLVAGRESGVRTKTWVVTSANPRSSHAGMDGETVPLGESFSNGMDGPGDFRGGADEVAGCTCDLAFDTEGN